NITAAYSSKSASTGHVGKYGIYAITNEYPAVVGCFITTDEHISQRRAGRFVTHPATNSRRGISTDNQIGKRRSDKLVIYPTSSGCTSPGYRKSIQYRCGRQSIIIVVDHAVAVSFQDGCMGSPIAI